MTEQKSKSGLNVLIYLIAVLPLLAAAFLYDQLPEQVVTHWGVDGEPDGWMEKGTFLIFMGGMQVFLPLLMQVTRRIDPKRENYAKFERAYNVVRLAVMMLLSGVFTVALLFNVGYDVNIQMSVLIGVGLLFLVLGNVTTQFRYNYFMGIRTAWTLANEEVWRRTHRLAGPLMMGAGVVALVAAFVPGMLAVWLFGGALGVSLAVPAVYSYWLFRKLQRDS